MRRPLAPALVVLVLVAAVLMLAGTRVALAGGGVPEARAADPALPTRATASTGEASAVGPVEALRAWDARRATAYAEGSLAGLRRLYTPGSRTGRADLALLRSYVDRGLVVEGLTAQVFAVEIVRGGPGAWRLLVTDRMVGAVARSGQTRLTLPTSRPMTRQVDLVSVGGTWRVEEATPMPARRSSVSAERRRSGR